MNQRSINQIVDLANFIMFDMGQPLHAFDADKLSGSIRVRMATQGESIETLDGKTVALDEGVLVIADDEGPIAIAGVKGGKRTGVDENTKNLVLESANFNPSSVRKTSTRLSLRTDASKRFENDCTPDLCMESILNFSALIAELYPKAKFSPVSDFYPIPEKELIMTVNPTWVSARLGMEVPDAEQERILRQMGLEPGHEGENIKVTVPTYRRDLSIAEDFVEEIGRIWGYNKLPETLPAPINPIVNKEYYYTEKVRNILRDVGFSEVYLYSLVERGELEVQLPLAEDKKSYRTNLTAGMEKCLVANRRNLALLGGTSIDIFEIGNVYERGKEKLQLGIASTDIRRVNEALAALEGLIGKQEVKDGVFECGWGETIAKLPEPNSYDDLDTKGQEKLTEFKPFSQYPFVLRDVAVWVPGTQKLDDVELLIKDEGGEWLVRVTPFDTFTKGEQTSYAFHLVFQSMERTLTDSDVNAVHARITKALNATPGFSVR
jgi:phenylalanyl-tRNA synthetase beta chain